MPDDDTSSFDEQPIRDALRVSELTLAWTSVASVAAVAIGITGNSLVLVAFGLLGLLDAAGSLTLIVHFRHALHHEAFSDRHERIALAVITAGMFVVGAATFSESLHRLVSGDASDAVPAGVVLAALSAVMLAMLSSRKRRIAPLVGSRALEADGWLSGMGSILAVVTLLGTGLTAAFDWWWVDAAAAAVLGVGAMALSIGLWRRENRGPA